MSLPESQITPAVSTATMMEKYTEQYIGSILSDADSIHDVTPDDIEDLKRLQAGRIVLDKYQVSVKDFQKWNAKDEQSGVEYDSQLQRVLIKSVEGADLYEYPNVFLYTWMEILTNTLWALSGGAKYTNAGRKAYDLSGPYVGDRKEPDQAAAVLDKGYPTLALEFGFNDETENLFESAKKWLEGSDEVVRGVILVDVKTIQHPVEETKYDEYGQRLTWGMTDEELSQSDFPFDDGKLVDQVTHWYEKNHGKLFERGVATIYLCRKGKDPELYWNCEFTPEEARSEIFAPEAVFTPKELLQGKATGPNSFAGGPEDKLEIPLVRLTEHLQIGLGKQEKDHARLMIKYKIKELDEKAAVALRAFLHSEQH